MTLFGRAWNRSLSGGRSGSGSKTGDRSVGWSGSLSRGLSGGLIWSWSWSRDLSGGFSVSRSRSVWK